VKKSEFMLLDRVFRVMDDLFEGLRRAPRRRVLLALLDRERVESTGWRRGGAATADGGLSNGSAGTGGGGRIGDAGVDPVAVMLHHIHLPRLDDLGFVDYDPDAGVVARGERYDEIRPLLELLDANADRLPAWP
jgi:hypothetical protein